MTTCLMARFGSASCFWLFTVGVVAIVSLPFLVSSFAFRSFLLFIVFLANRSRNGLMAAPPGHQSCLVL